MNSPSPGADRLPREAPKLLTERLVLRMAEDRDIPAVIHYYKDNEARFAPTDPPKPNGFHTEDYWLKRLERAKKAWDLEEALSLFLFEGERGGPVGTISFSQMFRGPFQACYLGYAVDGKHEGKGLMTEALGVAIHYLFHDLNFHRIMANHLPENERSARLLGRLSFVVEGLAKDYLYINGRWRDHVLNSLTHAGWR